MGGRTWDSFVAIFRKELVHMFRDRSTLVMAFSIPLFQLVLFGFIDQTVSNLPTVVVDEDRTHFARELMDKLRATHTFDIRRVTPDPHAARDDIAAGRARVGVVIPPDFHDTQARGTGSKILVLIDGSDSNVSAQALASVNGVAADENLQTTTEKLQVGVTTPPPGLSIQPIVLFNPDGRTANFIIPGLIAILLQIVAIVLTALSIVREREKGTLEQLLVTPIDPLGLMLGKLVPYLLLGIVEMGAILFAMRFGFDVPIRGSLLFLFAMAVVYLFALLSIGLAISTRAQTQAQAQQTAQMFLLAVHLPQRLHLPAERAAVRAALDRADLARHAHDRDPPRRGASRGGADGALAERGCARRHQRRDGHDERPELQEADVVAGRRSRGMGRAEWPRAPGRSLCMNTRRLSVPVLLGSLFLATSSTSHARPPNTDDRGFRDGANHHIGDESFVTRFGRAPVPQDSEALRMNTHLAHMHDRLAAGSATRPELAPMRARVLAALGEYVAKGTTPDNLHLPWRNPVFIDDAGTICAVGYLIQQTAGRPLAEKIASTHRYDMIEDIAAAMPDVAAWVASSGLTLEEIASIQPGYMAPVVETWRPRDLSKALIPDGFVDLTTKDGRIQGELDSAEMQGVWKRLDPQQRLAGSGEIRNGAGTWKSVYPDGALMAEGPFVHNVPHGKWQLFHPSGNLAAEGRFRHGYRDGAWQFFHDQPARVPIASGSFARGRVSGVWRHFDASGTLLAVSRNATPAAWRESSGGYLLDIVPGEDHVEHAIHQGNVAGDHRRLDMLRDGAERLYADLDANEVYDAAGRKLTETKGAWTESDCKWSAPRLRAAKTGDLVKLDGTFAQDRTVEACGEAEPVPPARAQHVEAMLASVRAVRSVSPEFVRKLALGHRSAEELSADEGLGDMAKVLAENMTWYIEWPHVDGRFIALFQTLPGYTPLGNDP